MNLVEALKSGRPIKKKGWDEYVLFNEGEVFQVYQILSEDWEVQPVTYKATLSQLESALDRAYIKHIMEKNGFKEVILSRFNLTCEIDRDTLIFTEREAMEIMLEIMGSKADSMTGSSFRFMDYIKDLQ